MATVPFPLWVCCNGVRVSGVVESPEGDGDWLITIAVATRYGCRGSLRGLIFRWFRVRKMRTLTFCFSVVPVRSHLLLPALV